MVNHSKIDNNGKQGQFIDFEKFKEIERQVLLDKNYNQIPYYQDILRKYEEIIAKNVDDDYDTHIFFSHAWDEQGYPDPRNWQVKYIHNYGQELKESSKKACFWYDYMSLPQGNRTPAEQKLFDGALDGQINRLSKTCKTVALFSAYERNTQNHLGPNTEDHMDETLKRAWIVTELLLAEKYTCGITHSLFEQVGVVNAYTYSKVHRKFIDQTVPALLKTMPCDSPSVIEAWLKANKMECTNGTLLNTLAKILHKSFNEVSDPKASPPQIPFNQTVKKTPQQVSEYELFHDGLSPHFKGTFFECKDLGYPQGYANGVYEITAIERPELPELSIAKEYNKTDFDKFRISNNGKSDMYPGIIFDVQKDSKDDLFKVIPEIGIP